MTNWQTKKLGDVAEITKGKSLSKNDIIDDGKNECIHYGELFTKYSEIIKKVESRTNLSNNVFLSKANDVLMPTSDVTPRGLATASYLPFNNVVIGGDVLVIRPKVDELDGRFFAYYVSADKHAILRLTTGSTIFHLYGSDMCKLNLSLPEKSEQQRIVGVLEVWDEYIEKLEQKIALKEQLKKGLMQQLLIGRRRLPGFNGEWHEVKLNDLVSITTGRKDVNQGNPDGEYPFFTCSRRHTYSDEYSFDDEAILIAGNGDVGHCKYYKGKFEAYQRTYVLTGFDKVSAQYIFPFLQHYFQNFIDAQKQMGAMPFIKVGMLKDFKVVLPIDKDEQESIAGLVADANDEISFLTDKMKAVKLQKKYLLKNLITGTIRTPEDLKPLDTTRLERSAL